MAGLDIAMSNALSGLKVNQQSLAVLSDNIANVNTANYSRRIIEQKSVTSADGNAVGLGVDIAAISRNVNASLMTEIRLQSSSVGSTSALQNYYSQIQSLYGDPNSSSNLTSSINTLFSSFRSLASNPELSSLRLDTVNQAQTLTSRISSLASGLQQLRFNIDMDMSATVKQINTQLTQLVAINVGLDKSAADNGGTPSADLLEKRDNTLSALAQNINFSINYGENGKVTLTTANGKGLLEPGNTYQLAYTQANSLQTFTGDRALGALTVSNVAQDGSLSNTQTLITGGSSSSVTTLIAGGKLQALEQLRDKDIPALLDQLDNLAYTLQNQVNALHNNGSGFPPVASFTGTTLTSSTEVRNYSGAVQIAILDPSGKPVQRANGEDLVPLTLNLGSLNAGLGQNGKLDTQTIVDEINQYYYYAPTQARAAVGNIADIKMVSTSTAITTGGTMNFNMELENDSNTDSQFQIMGVTASGGVTVSGAFPMTSTSVAGNRNQTGQNVQLNFAGGGGGPYTVSVNVKVTDSTGKVSLSTLTYQVNDNPANPDALNQRFTATAATGDGVYTAPASTQRFAKASIVDSNGNPVAAGQPGYLQIASMDGTQYRVAINQLDSKDLGLPASPGIQGSPATNEGFSQFFGLNNFFTDTGSVKGSALAMSVSSKIAADPNQVALGQLTRSPSYTKSMAMGADTATATLQFNNTNPSIGDTITVNGVTFTYVAAAAANNQITVGGSLATTLANTVAKLSASNATTSGTVDKATYSTDGVDRLIVSYGIPGTEGNSLRITGNFATAGISLNGGAATTTPDGFLYGGTDTLKNVTVSPFTYEIGVGSSESADAIASMASRPLNFAAAGSLSNTNTTISGYTATIISFAATKANDASDKASNAQTLMDGYSAQFKSESGVNLDEELANTVIYQNAYTASAKVITVTQKLFDILFQSVSQ